MRKRLIITLALIAIVLALPIIFVGVLLHTETGLGIIAGQLQRLERFGVHIEGLSGTISGPLRIAKFELNHPRVHVVVYDIVVYVETRSLLLQTINVSSFTARDALIEMHNVQQPPTDRPSRFLPSFMRVDARGVAITRARYVNANGFTIDADRARGEGSVSRSRLEVRSFEVESQLLSAGGKLRLFARKPMGLELEARGRVRQENQPELAVEAQLTGDLEHIGIKGQLLSPSVASADVVFTSPPGGWRVAGKVASANFELDPWLPDPPFSLENIALDVVATAAEVHAKGRTTVPQFDAQPLDIDARGKLANRVLSIASADIAIPGTPARLHTTGTVTIDGGPPTLDVKSEWKTLQWPLRGNAVVTSASGDATLRGPMPYEFTVNGDIAPVGIPSTRGTASGVLSKTDVKLDTYAIDVLGGALAGTGSLTFAQPRPWALVARGRDIDPTGINEQFPGRISFAATAKGQGLDKSARFAATIANLTGTLRNEKLRGGGSIERNTKGWRVGGAAVSLGTAELALDGTLYDKLDVRWSFEAQSLTQLLPESRGKVSFTGTADGPRDRPHVVADLRAEDLRYGELSAKQLTVNTDVDLQGKAASRFFVRAQTLGYGDPLLSSLRITGDGNADQHQIGIELVGIPAIPGETPPRIEMRLDGKLDRDTWRATLATTNVTNGTSEPPVKLAEPGRLALARDHASLADLCFAIDRGRLCANGQWQRNGPWDATVSGYEIPIAILLPPPGEDAHYEGRVEGRVHVQGAPGTLWQSDAGMRIIAAAIVNHPPGATPETLKLGDGGLAATATPQLINFSMGVQAFQDTFLYANARIERNGSNDVLHLPVVGDIKGRAADANILPVFFPDVDHAAGLLTAQADVRGTLASPQVTGRVELARGELDSYRVNLALRELSLIADLTGSGLDFKANGRAGDGRVNVDGRFAWQDDVMRGALHLKGDNLLVADLPEYRVVASPDLNFKIDARQMEVTGDVTVPSARIQPAQLSGAVRASGDARYVGETAAEAAGRFVVNSNVRIAMGDDVRVDTFGLQGRIAGGVTTSVRTGGDAPSGRGELSVVEGRYEAYGQKLAITRGRLLFDASPLEDPGLDIEARREIDAITVGLNVRGTLQAPRLTLFSDPSMSQSQIVSYLIVGKPVDSVTGTDTASITSARENLAVQGGGLLVSQLGRRIGLEEVGVENTVDQEGRAIPSLVLGKFLSPRLFISYGISLSDSINTLKLRYTISKKLLLKTEAGEQRQSADVEYTLER
jgi:translocation and assembly module TamB